MRITELIEKLQRTKTTDGDLEVMIIHFDGVEEYQTTVENLIVQDYKFQHGGVETIVKLTL